MIDLNYSTEQNQIVSSVRTMMAEVLPVERLRDEKARGPDALDGIAQFGGFLMSLPEEAGGAGLTAVEEVLLHIELGRNLVSPAALATPLAARLAHEAGLSDLVGAILGGDTRVCLGNALAAGSRDGLPVGPDGLPLHLYDADKADLVLVWSGANAMLAARDSIMSAPVESADRTVRISRATVHQHSVVAHLGAEATSVPRFARLLVAAQLLGMCEATRDISVDYAKIRCQFGQPIGTFQAVKHRCANMTINVEVLAAQLMFAAIAERDQWPDAAFQAEACWLLACRYALENARASIQLHGGIGFSAECDAHFYLLRAHLLENVGGGNHTRQQNLCRQPRQFLGSPKNHQGSE